MMTMMIGILTIMGFQLIASPKMPSGTFSKLLSPSTPSGPFPSKATFGENQGVKSWSEWKETWRPKQLPYQV